MPWLDIACVAVQAVLRLAACGLPALPPLENVGWDTLLESAPFIFPDPLLTVSGHFTRYGVPHNMAEVLQFNWLTQVDWAAGVTRDTAAEHGVRTGMAWVRVLRREVEKVAQIHGGFPEEPTTMQANLPEADD
eukprot:3433738-Pleurochrysis_carterae.AAC.1